MVKTDALIESRSLRESVIERTDILDRVKVLAMLPDGQHISVEMAANYYEVGLKAVESLIFDNKEELESDGLDVLTGERLSSFKKESRISSRAASLTVIPRRAVLRIGMLLRDSLVARSIREYLLNVEQIARMEAPEVVRKAISWRRIQSNVKAKRDLYLLVGVSKESAIAHALTHEELESRVDLTAFKREVRSDDLDETLTPTELGKMLEKPMTARKVNCALEKAGFQVKNVAGAWELTDSGKPFARILPVAVHKGDVTVEKAAIRWRPKVLTMLEGRL